jgi:hypothetical protein
MSVRINRCYYVDANTFDYCLIGLIFLFDVSVRCLDAFLFLHATSLLLSIFAGFSMSSKKDQCNILSFLNALMLFSFPFVYLIIHNKQASELISIYNSFILIDTHFISVAKIALDKSNMSFLKI